MTGKERAEKRSEANSLAVSFQIGKGGVSDAVIAQTEDCFNTKELIKIKVLLDTCPDTPREAADSISTATGAEVIQVIGGVIVLYRYNEKFHKEKQTTLKSDKKQDNKAAKFGKPSDVKKPYKVRPVRIGKDKKIVDDRIVNKKSKSSSVGKRKTGRY